MTDERRLSKNEVFAPAAPVVLKSVCLGLYHAGRGEVGVLACPPWGYEELCFRKPLRLLCEELAAMNAPNLRFDYPASGNSAGDWREASLRDWVAAAAQGADFLRARGAKKIICAGFGLGSLVAFELCRSGCDVEALVLVAPVANGRRHLRELAAWNAQIMRDAGGTPAGDKDIAESGGGIAGFFLSKTLAQEARAFDLCDFKSAPAAQAIVAIRPDSMDEEIANDLERLGVKVRRAAFSGYAQLVESPTFQKIPHASFAALQAAIASLTHCKANCEISGARAIAAASSSSAVLTERACLKQEDWMETGVRFGPQARLFGVLCQPRRGSGAEIGLVIIGAGRNPASGWRRAHVELARMLAQSGMMTLRFDLSDIGDSRPAPDQPEEILYSDWAIGDAIHALDFLQSRTSGLLGLYGPCSGAYLSLMTALVDERVCFLAQLNPFRLKWDPQESLEEALLFGNRSVGGAVARLSWGRIKDLLTGRVPLAPRMKRVVKQSKKRIEIAFMRRPIPFNPRRKLYLEILRNFEILRNRGVAYALAYTGNDDGLADYKDYFGDPNLKAHPFDNVSVALYADADHNLTSHAGGVWIKGEILKAAKAALSNRREIQSSREDGSPDRRVRS